MSLTKVKAAHVAVLKAINENGDAGAAQELHNQAVIEAENAFTEMAESNTTLTEQNATLAQNVADLENAATNTVAKIEALTIKVTDLEKVNHTLSETNSKLKDIVTETPDEELSGVKDSKKRFEKRVTQNS